MSVFRRAKIKMDNLVCLGKKELLSFIKNDDGDTNFISILVLLAIAMVLAAAFIGFKDQILGWVNEQMPDFFQ